MHPGIYPYKARYQVVGVDVCYKAFFIRCMFDRIGQSPHLLSLYQVYHSHADITNRICWIRWIRWLSLRRPIVPWCVTQIPLAGKEDSKPVECVQVLSSERKAIGNTWQNPVWRAWRKKMNITSLQCQETGDLLRQGREKCTGFQGWFAWKVSWKDSNCHIFCSYLN